MLTPHFHTEDAAPVEGSRPAFQCQASPFIHWVGINWNGTQNERFTAEENTRGTELHMSGINRWPSFGFAPPDTNQLIKIATYV